MSFKVSNYGWIPDLPDHRDCLYAAPVGVGGHAVMCVGYDDAKQWFIIRNSWGDKWGMKGYFTLPYSYVTAANLGSDFWTIRVVA